MPKLGSLRPVVDFGTLQAVVTHRYEVLARYAKSMKQDYSEELARLQNKDQFAGLKRWLAVDAKQLPGDWRRRAEGSGIRQLRDLSLRLRSYAVA